MKNACTFITRRCPRNCSYCDIHKEQLKQELTPNQWIDAFKILRDLDVSFNLILGNETWILGDNLLYIMKENKVPFALYTTCPSPLFQLYFDKFFGSSIIDNLSCGLDYSFDHCLAKRTTDMEKKSWDAWNGFLKVKKEYPSIDCHGTATINKTNFEEIPVIIKHLEEIGCHAAINFIHWNKDGKYDFFPNREDLKEFVFEDSDIPKLMDMASKIKASPGFLQNFELIKDDFLKLVNMEWKCYPNPYGGPTIDADGSLRLCAYRKGNLNLGIWDLPNHYDEWLDKVAEQSFQCPGCGWTYAWTYQYWRDKDPNFGEKVFNIHAGKHIPEDRWSKRRVE